MFVFFNYLTRMPLYLVWLVGIILGLIYWRRHPRISALATIAFGGLFAAMLFNPVGGPWGSPWAFGSRWTGSQMNFMLVFGGLFSTLLSTAAWVLILLAIFGGRQPPVPAPPQDKVGS